MNDLKIALIHATSLAMGPVSLAFETLWPQAQRMNLLDESLGPDLAQAGSLNNFMITRMVHLAQYAKTNGAQGILFSCSAFGPAIDAAAQAVGIPTLKPNEAMFDEALEMCAARDVPCRIGLLTTFQPAALSMHEELLAAIRQAALPIEVESAFAAGALAALNAGDANTHDQLVLQSATSLSGCDVLLLGQFSMARCQNQVSQAMNKPVLTSPASAVRKLKRALGQDR